MSEEEWGKGHIWVISRGLNYKIMKRSHENRKNKNNIGKRGAVGEPN